MPDGARAKIAPIEFEHAAECAAVPIDDLLSAENLWPELAYVLSDLRQALADPARSAVFCYYAIERISRYWAVDDDRDNLRWSRMHQALNVTEGYLRSVKSLADRPRHGHTVAITSEERRAAMARAWTVAGRFCRFLLGGARQLDVVTEVQLVRWPRGPGRFAARGN